MKLCTFAVDTGFGVHERIGAVTDEGNILDLTVAYALTLTARDDHPRAYDIAEIIVPADMIEFLCNNEFGHEAVVETFEFLDTDVDDTSLEGPAGEPVVYAPEDVALLAPLPRPNSLRCCSTFLEHLKNSKSDEASIPQYWFDAPLYYKGNPATVQGTSADVQWPTYTEMLDYGLQIACVIGHEGQDIPTSHGWDHIAGYMVFNDVCARDILNKETACMFGPSKSSDMEGGNIMGPYLVSADEFDPRDDHAMIARVNGEEWSRGSTRDMHHDFAAIVSHVSHGEMLHIGDVIGSGTVGMGSGWEIGRFPQPGDLIELEIEGIGVLANHFVKT